MLWSHQYLSRIDWRVVPLILALMAIGLLVISSHTTIAPNGIDESFFTPLARTQLQWCLAGWIVFLLSAGFDYRKLREWVWILYALMLVSLIGLFFTDSIQRVNRWYRIPFINIGFQPSESAKLITVIALSWFLERRKQRLYEWGTVCAAFVIVGIPFCLILKQPDLGSALVLFPVALVMFYIGGLHPWVVRMMTIGVSLAVFCIALIFLGVVSHEELRPYASHVLKSYQFKRLDPNTHHQKAAQTAIAVGGVVGTGWRNSEFTSKGWLPTPYTDAVFPAFGEEFGLVGIFLLLFLFYALLYFSFQVTAAAKDSFGRLLSAGITVYLTVHVLINIGMMSGFLPITGVPLILISYGGTSLLATMGALGILQSIYSRRFMF